MEILNTSIIALQIIFQIFASYFSYKIYKLNNFNKGWLLVTIALLIMIYRRFITLFIELPDPIKSSNIIELLDRIIVPILVNLFLFLGLYIIKRSLEKKK